VFSSVCSFKSNLKLIIKLHRIYHGERQAVILAGSIWCYCELHKLSYELHIILPLPGILIHTSSVFSLLYNAVHATPLPWRLHSYLSWKLYCITGIIVTSVWIYFTLNYGARHAVILAEGSDDTVTSLEVLVGSHVHQVHLPESPANHKIISSQSVPAITWNPNPY